jgi:hypothetical protein
MLALPQPMQQTLTDISVEIDPETVLLTLNRGRSIPRMSAGMQTAVAQARALIKPAAALAWVRVDKVDGQCVSISSEVAGGTTISALLELGPHADLMAPASIALISVGTIGDDLDAAVMDLNQKGDLLEGYFLDSAGVVALAEVGRAVRETAETTAAGLGWGVSPSLGPGTLAGWPLTGQRELWDFLDGDSVGIALSESGVLKPHKSATGLIGLGKAYGSRRVGSVCGFCQLRATCWRRRESVSGESVSGESVSEESVSGEGGSEKSASLSHLPY